MYYDKDVIAKARKLDLLAYLRLYESENLRRVSPGVYCTAEHDSLRISNGKWHWFSQGIGGYSALDYLVKVKGMSFTEAIKRLSGKAASMPPFSPPKKHERELVLPNRNSSCGQAIAYLLQRGIDRSAIDSCIQAGLLYESLPYHNAVFLGCDLKGTPRYAALRGTASSFKGEARGSDKRFSFSIRAPDSTSLHVFEGAVDLLSYATLERLDGRDWQQSHLLSLGGVSATVNKLPPALGQYLHDYANIRDVYLRLDNDHTGREAAAGIMELLKDRYAVYDQPPPQGKDYNNWLILRPP